MSERDKAITFAQSLEERCKKLGGGVLCVYVAWAMGFISAKDCNDYIKAQRIIRGALPLDPAN